MYLAKTPNALKRAFKNLVWDLPNKEKTVYLTFDDGPTPEVTEWVITLLAKHQLKATFFLVGENAQKHPGLVNKLLKEGHQIGNHTFNHLNGWKSKTATYLANVDACSTVVNSDIFRPPYGRIKNTQIRKLKENYKIIMWDVLSGDFDQKITPETCSNNVLNNVSPGSIIVYHDSLKAVKNLKASLPIVIESLLAQGYKFDVIT